MSFEETFTLVTPIYVVKHSKENNKIYIYGYENKVTSENYNVLNSKTEFIIAFNISGKTIYNLLIKFVILNRSNDNENIILKKYTINPCYESEYQSPTFDLILKSLSNKMIIQFMKENKISLIYNKIKPGISYYEKKVFNVNSFTFTNN